MITTKAQISVEAKSANFKFAMGDGYTIISINPNGTHQLMVKTADLPELVDTAVTALASWKNMKAEEKRINGLPAEKNI